MSQRIDIGIPESLEINSTNKFEKSYLDDTGEFVIAKYSGTSSVVIGNIKTKTSSVIRSALCSEINHLTICYPLLFTLTDNFIQAINIKSSTFEQIFQDSYLNEDIKHIITNSKYLVGIGIKRLIVWKRDSLQVPPKVIKMTTLQDDCGCGQIGSISQSTSFIDTTKIIIANRNPSGCLFQIWDIEESSLDCWARYPSKMSGRVNTEIFATLKASIKSGIVVGSDKGHLYIWNINNKVETEGEKHILLREPEYVLFEDTPITSIHVDKSFIIVGDSSGGITMLTTNGKEIYSLKDIVFNASPSETIILHKNKIVEISRAGRWVVASDNNGHMYLCDIFTPELVTPPEFIAPSNGLIKGFRVSNGKVTILSHHGKESRSGFKGSKNKPDVYHWTPPQIKDNPFDGVPESREKWEDSPVELLLGVLTKMCESEVASSAPMSDFVEKFCAVIKLLNEIAEREAENTKKIPFLLVQHAQKMLDSFEDLLVVSEKTSKSKHKEDAPLVANAFLRAISTISEIVCADESPYKIKNSFSYSESGEVKKKAKEEEDEEEEKGGKEGEDEKDGGSEDKSKRGSGSIQKASSQRSLRRWSKSDIKIHPDFILSKSGLHVKQRAIKDDSKESKEKNKDGNDSQSSTHDVTSVNTMLEELDKTFSDMHTKVNDAIAGFDNACSEGTFDREKAVPLINVYSSLQQFDEDFKEMGKDIATLRGVNYFTEYVDSGPWYGNGGIYEDEFMDSSLAAYSSFSVGSESSSSTMSTN